MEGYIAALWMFAGNFAPRGWAFCMGQILSIAQNTALFSLLGTTYGGNGQTTFALPDLRGRVPVGAGQGPGLPNISLGEVSGEPTHTLIITEMPAHNHTIGTITIPAVSASSGNTNTPGPGNNLAKLVDSRNNALNVYSSSAPDTTLGSGGTATIGIAGGSQPHNNMQPYLGMNYVICMEGIFPSRN
jgi:microcystin-dependent protein